MRRAGPRSGSAANRRPLGLFLLGLVVLIPVTVGARASLSRSFFNLHARGLRSDFALDYVFAKIGLDSGWSHLYDLHAQAAAYHRVGPGLKYFPLPYPPPVGWLAAPFTVLPVRDAYIAFETICVLAFLAAGWLMTTGARHLIPLRAALIASPLLVFPVAFAVVLGQVVILQLLGVAVAYWAWCRGRDVLAGVALLVIALHPQGLLLVPLVPLVLRRWRTVIAGAAAGGLVALTCLVTLGWRGTGDYISRLQLAQREPRQFDVVTGLSPVLEIHQPALKALVVLAVIAAVAWITYATASAGVELGLAAALTGSLLISPFIHINDLVLLAGALWLLFRMRPPLWVVAPVLLLVLSFGSPGYGTAWENGLTVSEGALLAVLIGVATVPLVSGRRTTATSTAQTAS